MVIDTGSSDSWLISQNFKCVDKHLQMVARETCRLGPGYTPSPTFKQNLDTHLTIQYGDGETLLGAVGTDNLRIGNLLVENREWLVMIALNRRF